MTASRSVVGAGLVCVLVVAMLTVLPEEGRAGLVDVATPGPYGGQVHAIAVHPQDPAKVLAATTFGIFASLDRGHRWFPTSGANGTGTRDVAWDPLSSNVAYAANDRGLFKSNDAGMTWELLPVSVDMDRVMPSQQHAGTVVAKSGYAVHRSSDSGQTWSTRTWDVRVQDIASAPSDDQVLYLTAGAALHRSTDGGATWPVRSTHADPLIHFVVDPQSPSTVYAVRAQARTIVRSVDGGATFEAWGPALTNEGRVWATSSDTVYVTSGNGQSMFVARSDDRGATWPFIRELPGGGGGGFAVDPTDPSKAFFGADPRGVTRTDDAGQTWSVSNTGLTAAVAETVATDPTNPAVVYAAMGESGLFRSDDGSATWTSLTDNLRDPSAPTAPPKIAAVVVDAVGTVYAAWRIRYSDPHKVLRSADGGATWTDASTGLNRPFGLVAHPVVPGALAVLARESVWGPASLYTSANGGNSWTRQSLPGALARLTLHPRTHDLFVISTDEAGQRDLWHGIDFGSQWSAAGLPDEVGEPWAATNDRSSDRLYVGSINGRVAWTDDFGASWTQARVGNTTNITALAVDPLDPAQVLAGTLDRGTWLSRNGGLTWTQVGPATPGMSVRNLTFAQKDPEGQWPALRMRPAFVSAANGPRSGVARMVIKPHNRRDIGVSGIPRVGRELNCLRGPWSRAARFGFRWMRNGVPIRKATQKTYVVRDRDAERFVRCEVTASGLAGKTAVKSPAIRIRPTR